MAEKTGSGPSSDYRELAKSFGGVAAEYDRARPSYPQELFDALERLAGRGLEGARVLDVGAGTGISTRLLAGRGADVVAVEPNAGMAAQFLAGSSGLGLVRGSGDELPFHDDSADFVTYAQAFHWTTPEKSVPEAVRVLRPGGALALWWNVKDSGVAWVRALGERLHAALPATYHGYGAVNEVTSHLAPYDLRTEHARLRWERRVSVDHVITDLTSRSYLAALTPEQRAPLLAVEREALLAEFPDGTVVEPYVLDLTVAVTPS
ncbi:class I SAM-dependent methyltransferase [Kitasatospora purpeofusca]|uniref:class I SAM-dependent methyltransferase n=1 Tax=Kitasatospora purpeofusca TaxID=67352 RepID=UPI00224FEC98|nr:class I SAM-dependent methyltransferase [Kitasatospora purpeofusca]MCX4686242.1 methyltransferase domain-containing protein [Kitasatospora purpeofusca]